MLFRSGSSIGERPLTSLQALAYSALRVQGRERPYRAIPSDVKLLLGRIIAARGLAQDAGRLQVTPSANMDPRRDLNAVLESFDAQDPATPERG